MSQQKVLLKNTLIYFCGSFGSKVLVFLLLPVYAKFLSQSDYGQFDLINTCIQLFYPIFTLMLDNAVYIFLYNADSNEQDHVVTIVFRFLVINFLVFGIAFFITDYYFDIEYYSLIFLWLITSSIFNVWMQISRGLRNNVLYSVASVVNTLIILITNIVGLVFLHQDYKILILSNIVSYTVCIFIIEFKLHIIERVRKTSLNTRLLKSMLKYSLPLIPNGLCWWALNASDRIMVSYYLGLNANGLYAMASKIPAILAVFNSIFSMAWTDEILKFKSLKHAEKYANKMYNYFFEAIILFVSFLVITTKPIFKYIIAGNFYESYQYTYFLYLGAMFHALATLLGALYGLEKRSFNVAVSSVLAALSNIAVNYLFMSRYGIQVASISSFVGFLLTWFIRLEGLRSRILLKLTKENIWRFLFLSLLITAAVWEGGFLCSLLSLLIFVLLILLSRKRIVQIGDAAKKIVRRT